MKKLIIIIFLAFVASASYGQLTLSEKSTLAESQIFRSRLYQALFSKANYWLPRTPLNLREQKLLAYSKTFVRGGAGGIDANVMTRLWLANYNGVQILDSFNQPIDSEILNSAGLDLVIETLAGVVTGDNLLPIQ